MKLISLNLAGRKQIENRISKITDFLTREKADIVCFQEVTFSGDSSLAHLINQKISNYYSYLQADLAENFFSAKLNKNTSDGLAVLSSLKITHNECRTLQPVPTDIHNRPDYHRRIVEYIEFENGLKLANIHLASNMNAYLQLEEILKTIPKGTLIVGDFNIFKSNLLSLKQKWQNDYTCSIEFKDYVSVPNDPPDFNTVDYLLLPKNKSFKNIYTTNDLSDHVAIVYEF